jgi:N utilization substance protein B
MSDSGSSSPRARQGARDLLVKALYQWQTGGHDLGELLEQFAAAPEYARADCDYFRELLAAAMADAETLDKQITKHADRDVVTVDAIGRAILLLALQEFNGRPDVPVKVVMNEAIELAKRCGPPDCYRFVNAVLDSAAKELPPQRQSDSRG